MSLDAVLSLSFVRRKIRVGRYIIQQ